MRYGLLTKERAERIREEARFQGWVAKGSKGRWTSLESGRIEMIGPFDYEGREIYVIELKWPGLLGPEYTIRTTEDWRKLKAKVDEIRQILLECAERGWEVGRFGSSLVSLDNSGPVRVAKQGSLGMGIEVIPPGGNSVYPRQVGGMRTWRSLCREFDGSIDVSFYEESGALPSEHK